MFKFGFLLLASGALHVGGCSPEQQNNAQSPPFVASSNADWQKWIQGLDGRLPVESELPQGFELVFVSAKYEKTRTPIRSEQVSKVKECQNGNGCESEPAISDIPKVKIKTIIVSPPYLYLKNGNGDTLYKWIVSNPEKYSP